MVAANFESPVTAVSSGKASCFLIILHTFSTVIFIRVPISKLWNYIFEVPKYQRVLWQWAQLRARWPKGSLSPDLMEPYPSFMLQMVIIISGMLSAYLLITLLFQTCSIRKSGVQALPQRKVIYETLLYCLFQTHMVRKGPVGGVIQRELNYEGAPLSISSLLTFDTCLVIFVCKLKKENLYKGKTAHVTVIQALSPFLLTFCPYTILISLLLT